MSCSGVLLSIGSLRGGGRGPLPSLHAGYCQASAEIATRRRLLRCPLMESALHPWHHLTLVSDDVPPSPLPSLTPSTISACSPLRQRSEWSSSSFRVTSTKVTPSGGSCSTASSFFKRLL